jgi:hypothetical protein
MLNSAGPATASYDQTVEELPQKDGSIPPGLLLKPPDFDIA